MAKSPEGILVFAEIKTALTPDFGDPAERVNKHKQRQIGRAAEIYLFKNRLGQPDCRFDVLAVRIKEGTAPQITHYENAFML